MVIFSAAVREDNPELVEARRLGIKTQKYAEALGELTKKMYTIAVSGMHGKSTTTAMIGLIMEKAGLDPTVIVGTKVRWRSAAEIVRPFGGMSQGDEETQHRQGQNSTADNIGNGMSNFRAGKSKYLVIEADEYDRSFLNYWPKILVLLNIEKEHLDTYTGGLPDIMETFGKYISRLPEDGVLVANVADPNVSKLILDAAQPTPTISPSQREGEKKRGWGFRMVSFDTTETGGLHLKIPGQHNLSNANAALAVARVLGIDEKIAVEALNNFSGAWRRMEYKGELNGAKIYDDYGHHPTEIQATLQGARELLSSRCEAEGRSNPVESSKITGSPRPRGARDDKGLLWCVFQPHQYHRTYDLFDKFTGAFSAADKVILLPIYSVAGREDEEIKKKVSSKKLVQAISKSQKSKVKSQKYNLKNQEVMFVKNFDLAEDYLKNNLKAGDVCVIMGAGDVYELTSRLLI